MQEKLLVAESLSVVQYGLVNFAEMIHSERSFEEQVEDCASLLVAEVTSDNHTKILVKQAEEAGKLDQRLSGESQRRESAVSLAHHSIQMALDQLESKHFNGIPEKIG